MFTTFFTPPDPSASQESPSGLGTEVIDWPSARLANTEKFGFFFREMLKRGVYLAPSQFEAGFLSLAHTEADLAQTLQAARSTFALMKDG
jgi:glutamate-1-semialdehyde 2,1-aminomutase